MGEKKKWYNLFVTIENSPGEDPPAAEANTPSVPADIVRAVPAAEFKAPLKKESEEVVDFPTIYEAAGIPLPKHGFTILKVSDMLHSEHLKNMTPEVKKNAILVALEAAGVKVEDVVQDAARRERALDTYAKVEEKSLQELEQQKAADNAAIQKEIDEFLKRKQTQIKANNDVVEQAKRRLSGWQSKKQAEAQRIRETMTYFVSENKAPAPTPP